MILDRQSQRVKSYTFTITEEEARRVRQKKILRSLPTLENRLRRARRNQRLREIRERNKDKYERIHSTYKGSPKY